MAEIGSTLGGRYRLIELLGQGGMATIYRANDQQLGRDVAVKILRPEYGRDPDFGSRFRHEAQSAASLNHPNIVSVYDYGQDPSGPFIVMELVDGEDLSTIVRRNGPLPPRQALRMTAEIARALGIAHGRGIIHRDVKPSNVLVGKDGRVKVTDFGIARAIAEAQMTLPGTTLGSVHYFSPEQARGEPAEAASDVFSLGIVLFELLTGRRPWAGDSAAAIAMARLTGATPVPSDVRAGIPPPVDAIVRKALAVDPRNRFRSADAFADALESVVRDLAGGTLAGAGPAMAGAGTATVVSGVARPNPSARVPYPADAYADVDRPARPLPAGRRAPVIEPIDEEPDDRGQSPWTWVAAALGILILAVVAFLVFQLVGGGGTQEPRQVTVPNFVGMTFSAAQAVAEERDLVVSQGELVNSDTQAPGTIMAQDPPANELVDEGSTVVLSIVIGRQLVVIPDLTNMTEAQAGAALATAGLQLGERTTASDPLVPAGAIIRQQPRPTTQVAVGTAVDYVVSTGPEPSPSPSPSPTPTPTPTPVPSPTPTPTPAPPSQANVGNYMDPCPETLAQATTELTDDGFVIGNVTAQPGGSPTGDWIVIDQQPNPGQRRPLGSAVNLTAYDPASFPGCTP